MYTASRVKRERKLVSRWRERAWNGDSGETRVLLGTETWAIAHHTETGVGWWRGGGGGGGRDASPNEDDNHIEQSSMGHPHISHTNTHTNKHTDGEPFSHTGESQGFHCRIHSPRTASRYLLPPRSSYPFDLSLSTLHCKSDPSEALGYLHTPAHTALYIVCHSQFDLHQCCSCGSVPHWEAMWRDI